MKHNKKFRCFPSHLKRFFAREQGKFPLFTYNLSLFSFTRINLDLTLMILNLIAPLNPQAMQQPTPHQEIDIHS